MFITEQIVGKRFRMGDVLETSGAVTTYSALDTTSEQPVVVKVASRLGPEAARRLAYEAELLSRLSCPHIVPLLDAGREGELYYLAMPRVGSRTLRDRLRQGPLPVRESLILGISLMRALASAHQHGLFHRDIKPDNIVYEDGAEKAVLIDFGIAGSLELAGSPAYMAPERLGLLDRPADHRADLYEAGLVLYEAVAGQPPFDREGPQGQLRARIAHEPRSLRSLRPEVPLALDTLVARLLKADPRERYQQADSALRDLEDILQGRQPVIGARDLRSELATPVLVGREDELRELQEQLRLARLGQVHLVRLVGASGSGKSRLLEAFAEWARGMGVRVLNGKAQPRAVPIPFQQFQSVFRDLAEEISQNADLREQLRPWGEVLSTAFEPLQPLYPSAATTERELPPRTVRAAGRLLTALPECTLLLLDDCQWSDDSLSLLLDEILGRRSALLVVAAYRDTIAHGNFLIARHSTAPTIAIEPLSKSEVLSLLESMAGPLPEVALEWVWSSSQGDPFLAESTLRGLVESGVLVREGDVWELRAEVVEYAQTSRRGAAVLAARWELLSTATVEICAVGALIGRRFEPGLVSTATDLPLPTVAAALEQARRNSLLWKTPDGAAYQFTHDRIQEALLARVTSEQMKAWHLRLAGSLKEREPERIFDIAYHFARGGSDESALPYALEAADRALKRYAPGVALEYFRIGERLFGSLDQRTQVVVARGLGESLASRGRNQEAETYYLRAVQLADRWERAEIEAGLSLLYCSHNPVASRAAADRALREIGLALPKRPLLAAARELIYLGLRRRQSSPPAQEKTLSFVIGTICIALGSAAGVDGKFALYFWATGFGINRLRQLPPSRYLPTLYANCAAFFAFGGLARAAESLSAKAKDEAKKVADVLALAQVDNRHQVVCLCQGRFSETVEGYAQLVAALEPTGEAWEVAAAKTHVALATYYRGDLRGAFRLAQEGLRAALRERDTLHYSSSVRLYALAGLGHPKPEEQPDLPGPVVAESFYDLSRALTCLYRGSAEGAIEPLKKAIRRGYFGFHSAPLSAWLVTAYRLSAEVLPSSRAFLAREYLNFARKTLKLALREGKRHAVSYPHALREAALLAARDGRQRQALRFFDLALEVARRQQMDYEIAWTLAERGRIGEALGWPDAGRDQGEGSAMLETLGAWIPGQEPPRRPEQVLSLVDRFSGILEYGRQIVGALEVSEILLALTRGARALLRTEDCRIVRPQDETDSELSQDLLNQARRERRTCLRDEGLPEDLSDSMLLAKVRSALCAPIVVFGEVDCWLHVVHKQVGQLYAEEERRIGDYLVTLAGAAIENARNQQERQKAQQRFQTLFRWVGIGTAIVDAEGVIVDSNPHFREMMGELAPEARIWDVLYHADRGVLEQHWPSLLADVAPLRVELRCRRPTSELLWTQVTASRPPGEELIVMAFADISERRLAQIAAFQESERRLLAAELHDGISQPLGALYYRLQSAVLKSGQPPDSALESCVEDAKGLVVEVSQLMYDLRNPIHGDVDSLQAIRDLARRVAHDTGLSIEAEISGTPPLLGLTGSFLYRLIQEALTNVRRHAEANEVVIKITVGDRMVQGEVRDDGQGFDIHLVQERGTRHLGLQGMRERAVLLGGSFEVESAPGQGTRVRFELPK